KARRRKYSDFGGCVVTLPHTCYDSGRDLGAFNYETSGQRESNPLLTFRSVAQFRHKHALDCALRGEIQISQFARIAQNNAVRLSEIVRKESEWLNSTMSGHQHTPSHRRSTHPKWGQLQGRDYRLDND